MDKHQELIEKFHENMRNQLLKEYQKNGTIKPKIILFLLNHEDKPNYIYKRASKVLLDNDPEIRGYHKLKKEMKSLIKGVEEDGYDVLSLYHVEYHDDHERLYTTLRQGKDLKQIDIHEYELIKDSMFVLPDGSIERGRPRLELLQMNW
jgi:hypothetical protein